MNPLIGTGYQNYGLLFPVDDSIERNFFSLAVFGGNLLADDVQSRMAMDRHLWASACSLEAWGRNGIFLLLTVLGIFKMGISIWEIGMFLCDNRGNFERFQYFNFETDFLENENFFQWLKAIRLKTPHHSHTKPPYQKLVLRQTEWWVRNEPITKNGVLSVNALFFLKILFQFKNLL